MKLTLHNIGKTLCEVQVDEINTGTLNSKEARELALHLIYVAAELLELEDN